MDSLGPSMLLRSTSRFEKVYHLLVTFSFGPAQGRVAIVILDVSVGSVFKQEPHYLNTAPERQPSRPSCRL